MSLKPSPAPSGCWQNNFKSIPVTPGEGSCVLSGWKDPLENKFKGRAGPRCRESCLGILPGSSLRIWGWILESLWLLGAAPEVTQTWTEPLGRRVGAAIFCTEDSGLVFSHMGGPTGISGVEQRKMLFFKAGRSLVLDAVEEGNGWGMSLGGR